MSCTQSKQKILRIIPIFANTLLNPSLKLLDWEKRRLRPNEFHSDDVDRFLPLSRSKKFIAIRTKPIIFELIF